MNSGKERIFCDLEDCERTYTIANALASPVRLGILRLLVHKSMTISELANELNVSISSISMHISILKDANLISVSTKPGKHGAFKVCGVFVESIVFNLLSERKKEGNIINKVSWEIPIGSYFDAKINAPCGILSEQGYVDQEDQPYVFFHPMHDQAQLLWFSHGELTYKVSNRIFHSNKVQRLILSFEVCSEAPGYNNDWPSDIFIKINGVKLYTFAISGDYGGQRGLMTPEWWSTSNTQFGELKTVVITDDGVFIDGNKVGKENLSSLQLENGYFFSLTLGTEKSDTKPGGMNLFGKKFGNHNQDIKVEFEYLLN